MSSRSEAGVIFDVDGVLVDSAVPHGESWKRLAAEIGGSVTEEQFSATFGRHNQDIIPLLFGPLDEPRVTELADRKEAIYRELIRRDPPVVDGARALIRALHDQGVRLASGSSGPPENIRLVLDAIGVADRFQAVISGQDVRRGKPDPEVFERAVAALSLPPERCVVIEDAPAGVEAACGAGTRVVGVALYHTPEALAAAGAALVVNRLAEIDLRQLLSLVSDSGASA